jgi:hypothetical protein
MVLVMRYWHLNYFWIFLLTDFQYMRVTTPLSAEVFSSWGGSQCVVPRQPYLGSILVTDLTHACFLLVHVYNYLFILGGF